MRTYECHVYFNSDAKELFAFVGAPSWIDSRAVFLGTFEFTHRSEPVPDSLRAWAKTRMGLLGIVSPAGQLRVRNYATHAYWGNAT